MRRTGVVLAALALCGLLTPPSHAGPLLQGTVASGSGIIPFCSEDAACTAFFAAGCPEAMVRPDGATISIADVSSAMGGKTATFAWSDAGTAAYDRLAPTTGSVRPPFGAELYIYLVASCEAPQGFPQVILAQPPEYRSQSLTVPGGTRWAIAWSMPESAQATWWAQ